MRLKNPFIKRVKFLVVKKYFSEFGWEHAQFNVVSTLSNGPGARFSKVPIINGPGKLSPFTLKIEVSIVLHLT